MAKFRDKFVQEVPIVGTGCADYCRAAGVNLLSKDIDCHIARLPNATQFETPRRICPRGPG
jgi:hypothetical protein